MALGAAAGVVSALLFASAIVGSGGFVLAFPVHFTALPLLFASLGLGTAPFAAACMAGLVAVVVGSGAGLYGAAVYGIVHLLPVSLIHVRLERAGSVAAPSLPGQLAAELALLGAVALLLILASVGFDLERLVGDVEDVFIRLLEIAAPDVSETARNTIAFELVRYFPGFVAVWWLLALVVSGVLAQALAKRLGLARIPGPDYRAFAVPVWLVGLFLVTLVPAALLEGDAASIAGSFALLFGTPLLLQGLALVHTVSRSWPGRRMLLFACYGSLIWPFAPLAWALFTALGVVEHFGRFRHPHLT